MGISGKDRYTGKNPRVLKYPTELQLNYTTAFEI